MRVVLLAISLTTDSTTSSSSSNVNADDSDDKIILNLVQIEIKKYRLMFLHCMVRLYILLPENFYTVPAETFLERTGHLKPSINISLIYLIYVITFSLLFLFS